MQIREVIVQRFLEKNIVQYIYIHKSERIRRRTMKKETFKHIIMCRVNRIFSSWMWR